MSSPLIPANPHLSDGDGTFPAGNTAKGPREALAILEEEIGKSGQMGWIHMSPYLASRLSDWLVTGQNTLETRQGNPVIPGAGYVLQNQKGPEGVSNRDPTAGQEWIYATGAVQIRRSQVSLTPENVGYAVESGINEATYEASRFYVVTFDKCLQAGVKVDRTATS